MRRHRKTLMYATALGLLGMVFFLYTRPDFMVNLANQVWSCF